MQMQSVTTFKYRSLFVRIHSYPYESLVVKCQPNGECIEKHNQTKCLHSSNKEGE